MHSDSTLLKDFLSLDSRWVLSLCMLQAGRAPELAAATVLEQMSHLVYVISAVGMTSWSIKLRSLMAQAPCRRCSMSVCVCRKVFYLNSFNRHPSL